MSKSFILEPRALYLCDQKADCCNSPICGLDCLHTKDVNHAKNGPVVDCRDWEKYFTLERCAEGVTWKEKENADR